MPLLPHYHKKHVFFYNIYTHVQYFFIYNTYVYYLRPDHYIKTTSDLKHIQLYKDLLYMGVYIVKKIYGNEVGGRH